MTANQFFYATMMLMMLCFMPTKAFALKFQQNNQTAHSIEEARRGIPIIYGTNNDIKPSKPLKGKARKFANKTFGKGSEVGFYYESFHIFFVNFWTWGGKFVIFSTSSQSFTDPSEKQWAQLLGKGGTNRLSKPFSYKFPTGLLILGGLLVAFGAFVMLVKPDDHQGNGDGSSGGTTDFTDENGFGEQPGRAA